MHRNRRGTSPKSMGAVRKPSWVTRSRVSKENHPRGQKAPLLNSQMRGRSHFLCKGSRIPEPHLAEKVEALRVSDIFLPHEQTFSKGMSSLITNGQLFLLPCLAGVC